MKLTSAYVAAEVARAKEVLARELAESEAVQDGWTRTAVRSGAFAAANGRLLGLLDGVTNYGVEAPL